MGKGMDIIAFAGLWEDGKRFQNTRNENIVTSCSKSGVLARLLVPPIRMCSSLFLDTATVTIVYSGNPLSFWFSWRGRGRGGVGRVHPWNEPSPHFAVLGAVSVMAFVEQPHDGQKASGRDGIVFLEPFRLGS